MMIIREITSDSEHPAFYSRLLDVHHHLFIFVFVHLTHIQAEDALLHEDQQDSVSFCVDQETNNSNKNKKHNKN